MGNSFSFATVLMVLGCLLLGFAYAWLLYSKQGWLSKKTKLFLAFLRGFTVAFLTFMLFAPLARSVSYQSQKPIVVLAQDNSLSVGYIKPQNFDEKKYRQDFETLRQRLAQKYEVRVLNFGDTVGKGFDFSQQGKLTNASALFNRLADQLVNQNVGAVVLATDGIFNSGGNPLYDLEKLNAPVYAIALGDTVPRRDLLVGNINYNSLVYFDNNFILDVQVQAFAAQNEKITLTVTENGKKAKTQTIPISASPFIKNYPITLRAGKIGVQQYTISLNTISNEITTKNNQQTIYIEVIDGRQKVLLATATAHPDIAVFKHAIEAHKHYQVTVKPAEELATVNPEDYSLIIAYQMPTKGKPQELGAKLFQSAVPIWYVLGAQTHVQGLNTIQNVIHIKANGDMMQGVFPVLDNNFTLFGLPNEATGQLASFDPLEAHYGNLTVSTSYQSLLTQKIGRVPTQTPLLFFALQNNRKVAFLTGEGLWRWKLNEAKDGQPFSLVNDLVAKSVQYLSAKDDKRKFRVFSNKSAFDENENVVLNATIYNDAYESVTSADVKLLLKNEQNKIYNATFSKLDKSYQLDLGSLPAGNYSYEAVAKVGQRALTAKGAFYVNAMVAEHQQTTANHQVLQNMARQSGGKVVMPSQLLTLAQIIAESDRTKTIVYEDYTYTEWINVKWIFFWLLLLMSIEWFFRKRNGEI